MAANETVSWHDNLIYALHLDAGDAAAGDWYCNLVLDIDHIVEWVCGADGGTKFRVAPATLTFKAVSNLRIALDCDAGAYPRSLHELSIDAITRAPAPPEKQFGQGPYWCWAVTLNDPRGGEIAFGASDYSLVLRAEPVLCDEQRLPARTRARFIATE